MRTIVHITGTTSGLGEALAKTLCHEPDVYVYGYARRAATFEHERYIHVLVDLASPNSELALELNNSADREVLINNAGWIGPVAPIGSFERGSATQMWMINTAAVMEWTNYFIAYSTSKEKSVLSISSGAGKNAIPSWSAYCASKAAIDMATRVWNLDHPSISFLAIAPGVVDTEMQADIRATHPDAFPVHQKFVDYHQNGELKSPKEVAAIILPFIHHPEKAPSDIFSVRDL
ncbi:SDR family NAD(P)-dependent oxidoreductase [Phaeocystidibacter marisrubri]|uniref:SDR family NAD(P)-dependent oxidoreductase n=1 Tax=Phaeocystidibacter marisrubri TaxID=1577780 RepID=A0A6L3ZH82_9FLAO|nr:SDR family NAD(P)-dependent oxidoreductase [Phaeocystidibacter marisrubri]KAB2816319.1 SDR family NAD(P)-dependent oxidoreductase [Phaeocystidibacter marisrubri]GGH68432.1 short-chain dehydrogenase/reductase [Phaeocystidibacter marisrubri]